MSAGDLVKVVTDRSSERILMPPLAVLLTSGRKRRREETLNKCLRETTDEEKMKTIRGMQSFFRNHTVWRKGSARAVATEVQSECIIATKDFNFVKCLDADDESVPME